MKPIKEQLEEPKRKIAKKFLKRVIKIFKVKNYDDILWRNYYTKIKGYDVGFLVNSESHLIQVSKEISKSKYDTDNFSLKEIYEEIKKPS